MTMRAALRASVWPCNACRIQCAKALAPTLSTPRSKAKRSVTAFTLFALMALAIGIIVAYRVGAANARRSAMRSNPSHPVPLSNVDAIAPADARPAQSSPCEPSPPSLESLPQLQAFAEDRRMLFGELADARGETARYRQIVIDIERNAPPPLLDAPGTPDDLKLIVGIGPVIERMLYQMGIGTYRQIALWSERDIDDVDARLREFPGRIRRDAWVTQARALHASKYGSPP